MTNPVVYSGELEPAQKAPEVRAETQPLVAEAHRDLFDHWILRINDKDFRFKYFSPEDARDALGLIVSGRKLQEREASADSLNRLSEGADSDFKMAKEIAHEATIETAVAIKGWTEINNFFTRMSNSDHLLGSGTATPHMLELESGQAEYFYERNPGLRGPSEDESSLSGSNNNLEFFYALSQADAGELLLEMAGCGIKPEGDEKGNPFVLKIGQVRFMFLETDMSKFTGVKKEVPAVANNGKVGEAPDYQEAA